MKVSLVVATVRRVDELGGLFERLREQVYRAFEVIVVDQNPYTRLGHLVHQFRSETTIH